MVAVCLVASELFMVKAGYVVENKQIPTRYTVGGANLNAAEEEDIDTADNAGGSGSNRTDERHDTYAEYLFDHDDVNHDPTHVELDLRDFDPDAERQK